MAVFSVKNVIEQSLADLWADVLDPANWTDGLSKFYDFQYTEMPLVFSDQLSLDFKIKRFRVVRDWKIDVSVDHEKQEIQFLQTQGPFKNWNLITRISDHGENQSLIQQIAKYELPLSIVGSLLDDIFVKNEMEEQISHFQAYLR